MKPNISRDCDLAGISRSAYYKRRKRGMSHEKALGDAAAEARGPYKEERREYLVRLRNPPAGSIIELLRRWQR